MVTSMIRLAAGVAITLAITVAGGPGAAVVSADPDSSRSSSDQSRDGGRGDGKGPRGHERRSRADAGNESDRRGSDRRGSDRNGAPGADRPGGAYSPSNDGDQSTDVTTSPTLSNVAVAETTTASRGAVVEPVDPPVVPQISTTPVDGERGGGSVLAVAGESVPQVMAPLVTVGNGRSPGLPSTRPGELPARIVGGPAVPQTVTVLPATPEGSSMPPPQPLLAVEPAPRPLSGTPVASLWGSAQQGWPAGVLFGIAGLLLAPIAGVWLGHRQSRAVKAASQLVSH